MLGDSDPEGHSHLEAVTEYQYSGGKWQWKEFSVPFGLLPSLVLFLWTEVGRAVIYCMVGKKRPKLFYTRDSV